MDKRELDHQVSLGVFGECSKDSSVSAYLLLAWMRADLKSPLTNTEVSKIVEISILSKACLRDLLDVPKPLIQNQNINELFLDF